MRLAVCVVVALCIGAGGLWADEVFSDGFSWKTVIGAFFLGLLALAGLTVSTTARAATPPAKAEPKKAPAKKKAEAKKGDKTAEAKKDEKKKPKGGC